MWAAGSAAILTVTRSVWLWPAIIAVSAAATAGLAFTGNTSPLRAVVALWFLLICPGMAFVSVLRLADILTEVALGVALSLAIDTIVASVMLYAGAWSSPRQLAIVLGITLIGLVLHLIRGRRPLRRRLADPPQPR